MLIDGKPFLWDVNPPNLKAATLPEFWKGLTADAFKIFEVVLPRPGECFVILQIGQKVEVGYTIKTFSRRRAIEWRWSWKSADRQRYCCSERVARSFPRLRKYGTIFRDWAYS